MALLHSSGEETKLHPRLLWNYETKSNKVSRQCALLNVEPLRLSRVQKCCNPELQQLQRCGVNFQKKKKGESCASFCTALFLEPDQGPFALQQMPKAFPPGRHGSL